MVASFQTHLGLLSGLNDDAIGGVVQLPRDDAEELSLVLVAVVVRGADADELRDGEKTHTLRAPLHSQTSKLIMKREKMNIIIIIMIIFILHLLKLPTVGHGGDHLCEFLLLAL